MTKIPHIQLRRVATALLVLLSDVSNGESAPGVAPPTEALDMKNCGLYCLYSATQWFDMDIPAERVIRPEYLSRRNGATMADLGRCATEIGLSATPMNKLRVSSLRATPYPIICSVRRDLRSKEFDHYVVVLPTENGPPKVFDPLSGELSGVERIAGGLWDGHGVVIAPGGTSIRHLFWRDALLLIAVIAGGVTVSQLQHQARVGAGRWAFPLRAAASLIVVTVVGTALAETLGNNPLLAAGPTIAGVQDRHFALFLDSVDYPETRRAVASGHVIIDARRSSDFEKGHIPGSINIPPDSSPDAYARVLGTYSPGQPFVVYCQSRGCPYAVTVARAMREQGFEEIAYYKNGWIDWEQHEPK